jgi:energy-coupling factor transporter ATP-binding protein EcfA2
METKDTPPTESTPENREHVVEVIAKLQDLETLLADHTLNIPYQSTLRGILLAATKLIASSSADIGAEKCKDQLQFIMVDFEPGRHPY